MSGELLEGAETEIINTGEGATTETTFICRACDCDWKGKYDAVCETTSKSERGEYCILRRLLILAEKHFAACHI
jgi:hypothetical protein